MAHLHKKVKKGRPYYYIREIARIEGKPKVVNQVYLGTVERILKLASSTKKLNLRKIQVQEYGALWIANQIDKKIDIAGIVDSVIPKRKRENGPTVGEYFLYAIFNRMIDSHSKRALACWFKDTAIHQIRPINMDELTSERFWEKWERVKKEDIEEISKRFFEKIWKIEPPKDDSFLFDTSNYYTFIASDTDSELAQRGKNKAGRNWLRQIGIALLVSRSSGVPLFYREYKGNQHDSKLFGKIMEEMFRIISELAGSDRQITVVFDKGMNSEANIPDIDTKQGFHFITTYSPCFAKELMETELSQFKPVESNKNKKLLERGKEKDILVAWRTTGEYWGKTRTIVITYNPASARKQAYTLETKLNLLENRLLEMTSKVLDKKPHWRNPKKIQARYEALCQKLHISNQAYELRLTYKDSQLQMGFRRNEQWVKQQQKSFGKNIVITDNIDWTTDEIVRASLDRYIIERSFRQSNDDNLVSVKPVRHWTDSRIRCHLLTCVVALTYLRLIEIRLKRAGLKISANTAMEQMHKLHSCLCWQSHQRKPTRMIEKPSKTQASILKAFGYQVDKSGVLQKINSK